MSGAIDANAKPLPVVLKAARDELLSSWLARHARFYGVTGSFFAKWLGLGDFRLSALDYRLGLEQVARLTEKFRCDPVTLIDMTQINTLDGQVCSLISRGRPLQICYPCADRYAHDGAEGAIPKHWSKAWRITCPACGSPLQTQTSIAAVVRRSSRRLRSKTYGRRPWRESKSSSDISPTENPLNIPQLQCCDCCWFRPGSQSQATLSTLSLDGCWARCSRILMCARDRSNDVSRTCR